MTSPGLMLIGNSTLCFHLMTFIVFFSLIAVMTHFVSFAFHCPGSQTARATGCQHSGGEDGEQDADSGERP